MAHGCNIFFGQFPFLLAKVFPLQTFSSFCLFFGLHVQSLIMINLSRLKNVVMMYEFTQYLLWFLGSLTLQLK